MENKKYPDYLIRKAGNSHTSARTFTKGKKYKVGCHGKIYDDNGIICNPCYNYEGFESYWTPVYKDECITLPPKETITKEIVKEEPAMTTVKKTTLINGTDCDNLSIDNLIALIREEEHKIETLKVIKTPSKKITKIITEHEATIKELVKVLDKK